MKLSGAQIQAFIRGSWFSTSHRPYPLRADLRVLSALHGAPGRARPGPRSSLSGQACSQVPSASRRLPFSLFRRGPHPVLEPHAHGRCLHSQGVPPLLVEAFPFTDGPLPWSHPTWPLPGRAASTPTLLTCLCAAPPECQADSWPPLWAPSVLVAVALFCLLRGG